MKKRKKRQMDPSNAVPEEVKRSPKLQRMSPKSASGGVPTRFNRPAEGVPGKDLDDWLQAEREIKAEMDYSELFWVTKS